MGYQVIKQPDGMLAIFSSFTDTWAVCDATAEEVVEWFVEDAVERARWNAQRVVGHVVNDEPRRV